MHDLSALVADYMARDSRVRWFDLPKGPGFGYENRNIALREAQGGAQTFRREPSKAFDGHLPVGALSEDQQWRWDGDGWQPKEERVAALAAQDEPPGHVSADGQWLWDGDKWRAVDNMSRRGENA